MSVRVIVLVSLILSGGGVLHAADAHDRAKATAQSEFLPQYNAHLAIDGKFGVSYLAWDSKPYGGGTKAAPNDVWWMLEMPRKVGVQGVKIIGDARPLIPLQRNLRVEYREGEMWKTAAEVRDAKTKTITVTWPAAVETATLRVFIPGRDLPSSNAPNLDGIARIVELLLILPGEEEKTVPEILGLTTVEAGMTAAAPEFPRAASVGLPIFQHQGVVLDYQGLKYNPCNDVIIPSVIRADKFQNPLGRYYMYYAPHNAPGGICLACADALAGPWKEYPANPLIARDWQPHYKVSHVSGPHAIWIEEERKLFVYYHGENDTTRFASSTDGVHFQYEGVAFTTKMFQDVSEASYARMFRYTIPGKDNRYIALLMGNNQGTRRIYLAWSKDGRTWEPRQTPLVDPPPGTAQVAQAWYLPWQGKHYLIYHAHWSTQPLVADLHVSEVDPAFEHAKYLGLLYDHTSAGPENVAQMSPCLVEENGRLYLFTNIGPRLNQTIAIATANAEAGHDRKQ
jgi:hypothetical protein